MDQELHKLQIANKALWKSTLDCISKAQTRAVPEEAFKSTASEITYPWWGDASSQHGLIDVFKHTAREAKLHTSHIPSALHTHSADDSTPIKNRAPFFRL